MQLAESSPKLGSKVRTVKSTNISTSAVLLGICPQPWNQDSFVSVHTVSAGRSIVH